MTAKFKALPPDESLQALAKTINLRLPNGQVNFYRVEHADGSTQTGIIYSMGVRRSVVMTKAILGEHDADEIVAAFNDWTHRLRPNSKWSTDPSEAA